MQKEIYSHELATKIIDIVEDACRERRSPSARHLSA